MLREALLQALAPLGGEVRERGEAIEFTKVLAERKTFLSRRKLVYRATVRVDEARREVHLWESLTETSSGLPPDAGAGFKVERYRTRPGVSEGTLAEQAKLSGTQYSYTSDFSALRVALEAVAGEQGYTVQPRLASR